MRIMLRPISKENVRSLLNIRDLSVFQLFLKMCAARCGQLINLSGLASDCGISHNTAKEWISILEAGYILFRVAPYFNNLGKRLVKTPKLYFYDSGLATYLLGIKSPEQLSVHPHRGAVFETFVASEIMKSAYNSGDIPSLYFWRDRSGNEIDFLMDQGYGLLRLSPDNRTIVFVWSPYRLTIFWPTLTLGSQAREKDGGPHRPVKQLLL